MANLIATQWHPLLMGLLNTILCSIIALVGSLIIGTFFALLEISEKRALRIIGRVYVEVFRNIPLLVITMAFFLIVPMYIAKINGFTAGTIGLTLYTSGHDQKARLVDMEGRVVREWGVPFSQLWDKSAAVRNPQPDSHVYIEKTHLFPNGDLLALYVAAGEGRSIDRAEAIAESGATDGAGARWVTVLLDRGLIEGGDADGPLALTEAGAALVTASLVDL